MQKDSVTGVNSRKSEFVYDGLNRRVLSYEYSWDGTANAGSGAWIKQSDVWRG